MGRIAAHMAACMVVDIVAGMDRLGPLEPSARPGARDLVRRLVLALVRRLPGRLPGRPVFLG